MHNHQHEITLGLSFFLGALHALEPGHGKTAMFVYLMGGRRSYWHPLLMGLTTAISHSVSLFVIAFGVHLTHHLVAGDHDHEEAVSRYLQVASALLVVVVGVTLLVQALRGKPIASCSCHGHAHSDECHLHQHPEQPADTAGLVQLELFAPGTAAASDSAPPTSSTRSSYRTTVLLRLAVGLLPCPTALAAYFTGLSTGSPSTAYLIVGLFAAGIACSLCGTGVLLQMVGSRLSNRFDRLSSLPWAHLRAGLILGIGLFYTALLWA